MVVAEQFAQVINPVSHQRQAVETEAEGEARPLLGVEPTGAQHLGVHHAAAREFQPTAIGATDVELGGRLGEREVRGSQAGGELRTEVCGGEGIERAGQVSEGDVPVHDQALDLVEHRHVRGVGGVAAETRGPA